jgi:hypothetical protein
VKRSKQGWAHNGMNWRTSGVRTTVMADSRVGPLNDNAEASNMASDGKRRILDTANLHC